LNGGLRCETRDSDAGFRCGPGNENFSEKIFEIIFGVKKIEKKICWRLRFFFTDEPRASQNIFTDCVWRS